MRILFISPRQCWPPLSGAKLRDYHLARALGQQTDLTYVHYLDPGASRLTREDLPFCREVIYIPKPPAYTPSVITRGLVGRWPLPVLNYTSAEMVTALSESLSSNRYDLIHLDSIHMMGCLERITAALGSKPLVVYDWHNIESEIMRRYGLTASSPLHRFYAALTARKLERLEHSILTTALGHIVCSDREQQQLLNLAPRARIAVLNNGVDTGYFSEPAPEVIRNRIVFVGSMNYRPNIEAAVAFTNAVWPKLRERLPGCCLTLVGAKPDAAVLALRQVDGVEVTGTVPDVRPYYQAALAAIVPLRTGGGTRLKILEAMAAGVPVVSSEMGIEGLGVESGKNILLAHPDDREAWIRALTDLAESELRRRALAVAAKQLVEQHYDWKMLGQSLYETYRQWLEQSQ